MAVLRTVIADEDREALAVRREHGQGFRLVATTTGQIAERSGGTWKPSAGSVYPTLQLLADEGLIEAEEQNGRKTYSLTEAGRAIADESSETPAPWESSSSKDGNRDNARFHALPKAGVDLAAAAAQVGRSGSPEQVQATIEILDEARRRLYSILAQD